MDIRMWVYFLNVQVKEMTEKFLLVALFHDFITLEQLHWLL